MDTAIQNQNDATGPALRRYFRTRSARWSQPFRCVRLADINVAHSAFQSFEDSAATPAAGVKALRRREPPASTYFKTHAGAPVHLILLIPGTADVPKHAWAVASAALGP